MMLIILKSKLIVILPKIEFHDILDHFFKIFHIHIFFKIVEYDMVFGEITVIAKNH